MMRPTLLWLAMLAAGPATAAVQSSSPDAFVIVHSAEVARGAPAQWDALLDWGGWWPAAHSYSGNAANLEIDAQPAGRLEETWNGGSVLHGTVVQAITSRLLRLSAAFGPLQAMPVNAILDIELSPTEAGTRLTLTYRVGGPASLQLDRIAPAVDGVLGEAFGRLSVHSRQPLPQPKSRSSLEN